MNCNPYIVKVIVKVINLFLINIKKIKLLYYDLSNKLNIINEDLLKKL